MGVLLRSFALVGSQVREGKLKRLPSSQFSCRNAVCCSWFCEFLCPRLHCWSGASILGRRAVPNIQILNIGKHSKHSGLMVNFKPPWVDAELAALVTGAVQLSRLLWNTRLGRDVKAGEGEKTMEPFYQMQQEGTIPNRFTIVSVINACASLWTLECCRWVHTKIIQSGCDSDLYVNMLSLTCMPNVGASGCLENVQQDTNMWCGCLNWHDFWTCEIRRHGNCFSKCCVKGCSQNLSTFVGVLTACAS